MLKRNWSRERQIVISGVGVEKLDADREILLYFHGNGSGIAAYFDHAVVHCHWRRINAHDGSP
jgi:hypothetical protein